MFILLVDRVDEANGDQNANDLWFVRESVCVCVEGGTVSKEVLD